MHLQGLSDEPGACPICGMALEPVSTTAFDDSEKVESYAEKILDFIGSDPSNFCDRYGQYARSLI